MKADKVITKIFNAWLSDTNGSPVDTLFFDEVEELDGDELLTIEWKQDGTIKLYKQREDKVEVTK